MIEVINPAMEAVIGRQNSSPMAAFAAHKKVEFRVECEIGGLRVLTLVKTLTVSRSAFA
jgi:hypothetical protein